MDSGETSIRRIAHDVKAKPIRPTAVRAPNATKNPQPSLRWKHIRTCCASTSSMLALSLFLAIHLAYAQYMSREMLGTTTTGIWMMGSPDIGDTPSLEFINSTAEVSYRTATLTYHSTCNSGLEFQASRGGNFDSVCSANIS